MPYEPVAHGKLHGLDYRAARPFINWLRPQLHEKIKEWLTLDPPRLELATLAYGNGATVAGGPRSASFRTAFHLFPGWRRQGRPF